jgi:hypothetical protein
MKLVNVRLEPDDARKAEALQAAGVPVSSVVRRAIRSEYARRLPGARNGRRPSEVLAGILARHPDTGRSHGVDTTDRHAVQRFIRRRLRKSR